MFAKLARKIQTQLGLTKSEAGVILFLSFGLIVGGTAKLLKLDESTARYDFTKSDSSFEAASSKIDSIVAAEEDTLKIGSQSHLKTKLPQTGPIDLNKATVNELTSLPGVGKATAQKIIEYRSSVSKFDSVTELMKVKGIGPKKFQKMKPYIKVE